MVSIGIGPSKSSPPIMSPAPAPKPPPGVLPGTSPKPGTPSLPGTTKSPPPFTSGGGGGGGGSGGGSSNQSSASNPTPVGTKIGSSNMSVPGQKEADVQRTLARQNAETARNALQSDTNYSLKTKVDKVFMTDADRVRMNAQAIRESRINAGTFNTDTGFAREVGLLKDPARGAIQQGAIGSAVGGGFLFPTESKSSTSLFSTGPSILPGTSSNVSLGFGSGLKASPNVLVAGPTIISSGVSPTGIFKERMKDNLGIFFYNKPGKYQNPFDYSGYGKPDYMQNIKVAVPNKDITALEFKENKTAKFEFGFSPSSPFLFGPKIVPAVNIQKGDFEQRKLYREGQALGLPKEVLSTSLTKEYATYRLGEITAKQYQSEYSKEEAKLISDIQSGINTFQITPTQGNEIFKSKSTDLLNQYNTNLNTELSSKSSQLFDLRLSSAKSAKVSGRTSGDIFTSRLKTGTEIGALTATSLISPQLGVVTAVGLGVSKSDPREGLFIAGGGLIAGVSPTANRLANSLTKDLIADLDKQAYRVSGAKFSTKGSEDFLYTLSGSKSAGGNAISDITIRVPVFKNVKPDKFALGESKFFNLPERDLAGNIIPGKFKITERPGEPILIEKGSTRYSTGGGIVKQEVRIYNEILGKDIKLSSTNKVSGFSMPQDLKGFRVKYPSKITQEFNPEGVSVSTGSVYTKDKTTGFITSYKGVGLAKEIGENINVLGMKPYKLKIYDDKTTISGKLSLFGDLKKIDYSDGFDIVRGSKSSSKDTLTFYHGTTDKFVDDIVKKGLIPSSKSSNYQGINKPLDYVSASTTKDFATSFANRASINKGGKPVVLGINIPKSELSNFGVDLNKVSGIGEEVRFTNVPAKYLKPMSGSNIDSVGLSGPQGLVNSKMAPLSMDLQKQFASTAAQFASVTDGSLSKVASSELNLGRSYLNYNALSPSRFIQQNQQIYKTRNNFNLQSGLLTNFKQDSINIFPVAVSSGTSLSQQENLRSNLRLTNPPQFTEGFEGFNITAPLPSFGGGFRFGDFGPQQSLGGFAIGKPRKRGKKSGFNIAPSFGAIVQNIKITSPLQVSRKLGVTPFQTRGLLVGKKSKGSYFKFTDI